MIRARRPLVRLGRRPRQAAWPAVAAALAIALGAGAASAASSPSAAGGGRALGVSVPPDPIAIAAGSAGRTSIRIVNPTPRPVPVTLSGRSIVFGDNGRVTLGPKPDPSWSRLGDYPVGSLTVPRLGYVDIPLTIRMPRGIHPDLYFLGFVVTPTPTSAGDLQVINQIGSFLTIDVPGPRTSKLAAAFHVPGVSFGSHAAGTLQITNAGGSTLRFWGESDTTSSPGGGRVAQQRFDPSLLPRGRSELTTVEGKPSWPIGIVTMTVHLFYSGRTESSTKELVLSRRVVVISPVVPVSGAVALVLAGAFIAGLRRRRRRALPA